ncbi:hypothetical protein QOZ80_4BG0353440 [Eleusine coracana subsp. coracana]|nr:hypothetical protein QOZ80_4BG0353440 [Eleusine coracana subsp. coracana]
MAPAPSQGTSRSCFPLPFKSCASQASSRDALMDVSSGATAVLVSPLGRKVWPVQVGRDGDGAFLGNGWPEFVAAHGIGVGWFVVFRHEGGGVLTIKAFDTSCCLRDFSYAANKSKTRGGSRNGDVSGRRPHFIKPILPGFTQKMAIHSEFVRKHMSDAALAVLIGLGTKFWRVELERDPSGNVFLAGGWPRFLASHGIAEGEALLLRHEGNMVFTVKVFGLDGCQKNNFKPQKQTSMIQETLQSDETKTMTEQEDCPSFP